MTFKEFSKLIFIEGYIDNKPDFMLKFLNGCISGTLNFNKSTINGYMGGDGIKTLAKEMKDLKFTTEKAISSLESMYESNHKGTPTFTERYESKTYKEALYDKFNEIYPEVPIEKMSKILAEELGVIIEAILKKVSKETIKPSEKPTESAVAVNAIISKYTFTQEEKKVINNICSIIVSDLKDLLKSVRLIKSYISIIGNEKNTDEDWINGIKDNLIEKQIDYEKEFKDLRFHYKSLYRLLESKKHLHESIEKIINIIIEADKIRSQKIESVADGETIYEKLNELKEKCNELPRIIDKL